MSSDILVFWRRPDGTRCVVGHDARGGWELRIVRDGDRLLVEHFTSAPDLFARAQQLRDLFNLRATTGTSSLPSSAEGT